MSEKMRIGRLTGVLAVVCMLSAAAHGQTKAKAPAASKTARVAAPAVNKQALAVLQQAASLVAQVPLPVKEYDQSRVQLLSSLGEEQWKAGDHSGARKSFDEALRLAKRVKLGTAGMEGGSEAVQTVARSRAQAGDAAGVQALLPLLSDFKGEYSGTPRRSAVLGELAGAQVKAGDMKAAAATAERIKDAGERKYALMGIMQGHVRRGDEAKAKAILGKFGPDDKDFASMRFVQALVDSGKITEAIALAAGIPAPPPAEANGWFAPFDAKAGAQRSIAIAQAKAGDIPGTLLTISAMPDNDDKFDSLLTLMKAQRKAGDIPGAERTYSQCLASRSKYEKEDHGIDISHAAEYWQNAVRLEAYAENWDQARKAAEDAAKGQAMFGRFALDSLVEVYGEAKNHAGALEATKLAKPEDRVRLVCRAARAQAEDGKEADALSWVSEESAPELKANALIAIAQGILNREREKRP